MTSIRQQRTAEPIEHRIEVPTPLRVTATAAALTAGILLLVIVGLTVSDVLSRNLRSQSILGTVDLSTLLLVSAAYLGLAHAEITDKHVAVDLVEARFSAGVRAWFAVIRIVLIGGLAVVLVRGLVGVLTSAIDRVETTNGILRLATWPAKAVLLASFILFFICALWRVIAEFREFRKGVVPVVPSAELGTDLHHVSAPQTVANAEAAAAASAQLEQVLAEEEAAEAAEIRENDKGGAEMKGERK